MPTKKVITGPIRDKEKTKGKMLAAVGKIIQEHGYTGLKISKIAKIAGCDKKLIYDYYGSADKLIAEYVKGQDYWNKISAPEKIINDKAAVETFTKDIMRQQFELLKQNKELQKIILWELSEDHYILKLLADSREANGEALFQNLTDRIFERSNVNFRAISALLISGIYYLNIHTEINGSNFCGINLKTEEGREEIRVAIDKIIEWSFEKTNITIQ